MTGSVQVWYSEVEISILFLYLFMSLYITQVLPIIFHSNDYTLKYFFYTKPILLSYSTDVVSFL